MKKSITLLLTMISFITAYSQSIKIEEIGCKLTSDEKKSIQTILEFESEFYQDVFDLDTVLVKMILFGDFKKYSKYQKRMSYGRYRSKSGFYLTNVKTVVVYKNSRFLKTVNHEMSHSILRSAVSPPVPKWINEGLAEWFEYFYVSDNRVTEGIQNRKVAVVKELIDKKAINLKEFLKYSNKEWQKKNNSKLNYYPGSVSYCLVYFLYKEQRSLLKDILIKIKNGEGSIEAFNSSYPGGIKKLQGDFEKYFKK